MSTSILQSSNSRPLYIDFELYTDGDLEFKKELIVLMVDNLKELQQTLKESNQKSDVELFKKTCHKIKPTIAMLEDKVFNDTLDELKEQFASFEIRVNKISALHTICNEIIKSLEKEGL